MDIAVLLTCHNRRAKTENCLRSLKDALAAYNNEAKEKVCVEIFLTDDGCTDGTAEAARGVFPDDKMLHILKGDGNLYWAGGMRFCWREAMKRHSEWDYYLLLNDDAELMQNVLTELFYAEQFAEEHYRKKGLVSGITCSKLNTKEITYGGEVRTNRFLARLKRLTPNGEPQLCDLTNANILLVPAMIVDDIGIFYEKYRHGKADYDYSVMARRAGYPVVLTANPCAYCERDHWDGNERAKKVISMSLEERKSYFANPVHSMSDHIMYVRRTSPIRLPMVWIGRMLNLYCPKFYYHIKV